MTRDAMIAAFLRRHGFDAAQAVPLAQDASFRRYLRLRHPRPAVLMDAPPPEDVRRFLQIAAHLEKAGLSVPAILGADPEAGLVLEEDLGDDLLSMLVDRGDDPGPLLDIAIDALVVMQRAEPPADLPPWDAELMAQTAMGTFFDWFWPACYGTPAPDAAKADVADALAAMLAPVAAGPRSLVHRDFFVGNLLFLPDRDGPRRVGIIDFQGAAWGHPAYDLVSLLQDARRDIPADAQARAFARYLAARPELDAAAFATAYDACAAQRHLRVACQWVRLAKRDGRPHYLAYGPWTWRLLDRALRRPAARPLQQALDLWLPPADRANPPELEHGAGA
ncbi:aminoglycoside phosphotransferase family protein [Rhodopila sp.]|jgi:aminoglycoside/choline kinase family phosphotransferase|uniref:aminoglycoside phosphotransferase family protein n=1 Tax=Rhodopila sp. TaxID=2480087 RepID=UPI002C051C42|nr:phosphotransferase [Rhodopila sp.]HVZ08700.1 phosphotransferase [Rhodopila sp.]